MGCKGVFGSSCGIGVVWVCQSNPTELKNIRGGVSLSIQFYGIEKHMERGGFVNPIQSYGIGKYKEGFGFVNPMLLA